MENKSKPHKLMITCKESTMLSVKKAEIGISFQDRLRLMLHHFICKYCRLFDKQNKIVDKVLENWKVDKKLSEDQKKSIQQSIDNEIK